MGVSFYFAMFFIIALKFFVFVAFLILAWIIYFSASDPVCPWYSSLFFFLSMWDNLLMPTKNDWPSFMWKSTLVYCILYQLVIDIMEKYIYEKLSKRSRQSNSAAHYSLMIVNVPLTLKLSEEEDFIKEILHEHYKEVKVINYTFAYDLDKPMGIIKKYISCKAELNMLEYYVEQNKGSNTLPYIWCNCCYSNYNLTR